jgi:hypothetical protein
VTTRSGSRLTLVDRAQSTTQALRCAEGAPDDDHRYVLEVDEERRFLSQAAALDLALAGVASGRAPRGGQRLSAPLRRHFSSTRCWIETLSFVRLAVTAALGLFCRLLLPFLLPATVGAGVPVCLLTGLSSIFWAAVAAPTLVIAFTAMHEAVHWWVLRRVLRSSQAGALFVCGWAICILRPRLTGRRLAVVSGAGPLAAGLLAVGCFALARDIAWHFVFAAITLVHLVGLTPLTTDGAQLIRGLQGRGDA